MRISARAPRSPLLALLVPRVVGSKFERNSFPLLPRGDPPRRPRLGCLNVHASLLPRLAAAGPRRFQLARILAVRQGERAPFTIMQMYAGPR